MVCLGCQKKRLEKAERMLHVESEETLLPPKIDPPKKKESTKKNKQIGTERCTQWHGRLEGIEASKKVEE